MLDAAMELPVHATLGKQLLAYCERDTLAMVRLYERLRALTEI